MDIKEEDEENEGESGDGGDGGSRKGIMREEELWARLDELEKLEELQDEQDRYEHTALIAVISAHFLTSGKPKKSLVFLQIVV